MAWLMQWWTLLATVLVVFVPGLAAAWAIGLRRLGAWAFAPVGSVAMITIVATLYGFAGIAWNLVSALLGLAVVAALLLGARLLLRIPRMPSRVMGARWPVITALVVAAVLLTLRVTVYISDPGNISQTNDAAFHLGAVRAIIEQGDASSFGLAGLIDPAARGGFYPGAWHATCSLIALMGGSIAVATNMLTVVVAAVVWPLGIAWLTQVATRRRLAAAAAAAMSPVLVIFPLEMMQYGVLYPYFLAVALLPAAIGALVAATRRRPAVDAAWHHRLSAPVLAFALAGVAIGNAHPSVLLAWGLVLWLYLAGGVVLQWRRGEASRWWGVAGLGVASVSLGGAWLVMARRPSADVWGAVRGGGDALVEILSAGFVKTPPAWWMTALVVVGLIAVLRRAGTRWLAFGWLAFVVLAFVAYAVHTRIVRVLLVGAWYSDPYRMSALVPVMMIPVAAAGVVLLVDMASAFVLRRRVRRPELIRPRIGAIAVGVLLAIGITTVAAQPLVLRFKLLDNFAEKESPFLVSASAWLSPDERTLLSRVASEVPRGVTVLGNPGTGAALGYFLTGVDIFPAKWQVPTNAAYTLLKTRLPQAATDPAVCEAVHELNAGYVLDFGEGDVGPGVVQKMPGFTGFDGIPGFQLVDHQGAAALWRITACL